MKSFLPLLFCFLFAMKLSAQNLVPNGSFEELIGCPGGFNAIDSCAGWFTEIFTPDCIATCAPYPVSVPNNAFGFQYPFEGDNYAGIITFISYFGNFAVRETFGAKLIDSLVIGNIYHFSMRVCHAYNESEGVIVSTNHLSVKFSNDHHTDYAFAYDNLPQLYEDSIITDSVNWVLLQWDYIADSAYKYIYIGDFFDNAHIDTLNAGQPFLEAYYYVDSVNLFCVSANCETGISNKSDPNTWMQYNEESGNLNFHLDGTEIAEFFLVNIIGEKMLQTKIAADITIPLSSLTRGIYIGWLRTENGNLVKKISIH